MCIDAQDLSRCHVHYRRQGGLTLIELVIFIVIISVGLAGVLASLNFNIRNSANPMIVKQQVAIAESLLEEISRKPFTWCDPDDPAVSTATSKAGCATPQNFANSPQAGEDRYSQTAPFDNVLDYNGFSMTGIRSAGDGSTVIPGLGAYSASVTITEVGTDYGLADDTALVRIDVTVSIAGQPSITISSFRARYAPNAS